MRRQILSGVKMISGDEARAILGRPDACPSWCSLPKEGCLLRVRIAGSWRYPVFQFDLTNRRIDPGFVQILAAARAAEWSDLRLLNWLMRPHFDFDGVPAEALQDPDGAVLAAFLREIEPECHG
ncbi:hypothetical protein [Paracoccus sp. T5]|uniref:hypothetical protein n=1 Tax=Paracoccus sp. T5 TaxID=3402161 RepID=UPI003AED0AA4